MSDDVKYHALIHYQCHIDNILRGLFTLKHQLPSKKIVFLQNPFLMLSNLQIIEVTWSWSLSLAWKPCSIGLNLQWDERKSILTFQVRLRQQKPAARHGNREKLYQALLNIAQTSVNWYGYQCQLKVNIHQVYFCTT